MLGRLVASSACLAATVKSKRVVSSVNGIEIYAKAIGGLSKPALVYEFPLAYTWNGNGREIKKYGLQYGKFPAQF